MDTKRAYNILCEVAKQNGVTVEKVIADIDHAIEVAISTARKNNDRRTLMAWSKIQCAGDKPTALEVVACLGELMITGGSLLDLG